MTTPYTKSLLLFSLNALDAVLTIFWVRNNYAEEGNRLMAYFLDLGDLPFLLVKLLVGATAAFLLYHWRHLWLARTGLTVSLGIYTALMGIHFLTALSALGFHPELAINFLRSVSDKILTVVI